MLKTVVAVLLLVTMAMVVLPQTRKGAGKKTNTWLNGTWEGKGYQIDTDETWTMRLTVKGNKYLIEYPSLNCDGKWRPVRRNSWLARFREEITRGVDTCTNLGNVVIQRLGRRQIAYRYSNQGSREITASAILNRKQ
jgi:hypothetical protein